VVGEALLRRLQAPHFGVGVERDAAVHYSACVHSVTPL
jgi:hypothetical protein